MGDTEHLPVIFGVSIEGLRRAVGKRFTPELKARALTLGVDVDRPQAAYPLDTWVALLRVVADELFEARVERRYYELGRQFVRGFVETAVGFAAMAAARVLGTKRTLTRMGRNFRTGANFVAIECVDVGPNELILKTSTQAPFVPHLNDRSSLLIEYRQGILQEVLAQTGARGTVELLDSNLTEQRASYRVRWE